MIALIVAIVAAVALFVIVIGMVTWTDRREIKDKQGKPICGCDHHRAMHDPKTNECHGKDYEGNGVYARCTCRQYVGPEPLPSYYAPEIESGER